MIDSGFGVGGYDRCVWEGVWKLSEAFCGAAWKGEKVQGWTGSKVEIVDVST